MRFLLSERALFQFETYPRATNYTKSLRLRVVSLVRCSKVLSLKRCDFSIKRLKTAVVIKTSSFKTFTCLVF